ncbi:MAG: 3'-5' exonuclease [Acidimicrobiales bacterium]
MSYEVVEAQTFWDSVMATRRDDGHHAHLLETLIELRRQPFHNSKLQTHDVGTALNGKRLFSSDVGGRRSDRRLVWQVFNKTLVVLLYGTHAVQDRAKRMRIGFDPADKVVTVYELATDTKAERTYQQHRARVGKLYMAWTDAELVGFGFKPPTFEVLRGLNTDDELLALESRLDPETFERAVNVIAYGNPEGTPAAPGPVVEAQEPKPTDDDLEIERHLDDDRAGAWFTRTEPEYMREILARPIEDWMIFLHPDQRWIVRRHFEGPARVRGAAGTGKTVVGLHRAAWLAERNREAGETRPVLFTTFIKSLPPVFEALYLRLPGTRAGEVEFVHIDRLAAKVCAAAGDRQVTAPREIDAAFATAHKRQVFVGTPLADAGFGRQYLRDEITSVIKGRGITSLDTYLEIVRTGRRAPMTRRHRAQVWDLMLEWDAEMERRGTVDFVDVVRRARDHARDLTEPHYLAAIVDEAQDLSLVGLQLVRALVNAPGTVDRPDGLLLLGDGAQRIYAGGFKLRQAGVEVRGRTTVLRVNYRNTREIIGTALAVAGDSPIDDLGEEFRRGDETAEALRHGAEPWLVEAADLDGQLDEVARHVQELTSTDGIGPGDVAILVPTNWMVDRVVRRLRAERITAQELTRYEGRPNELVKVGTYHRGKGLEFKAVLLPGLSKGVFPRPPDEGQSLEEAAEARDLALSTLFVAMTRARDVLIVLYDSEPSDVLAAGLDRFERASA